MCWRGCARWPGSICAACRPLWASGAAGSVSYRGRPAGRNTRAGWTRRPGAGSLVAVDAGSGAGQEEQGMSEQEKERRREVALFRFRVIGEIVSRPAGSRGIGALLEGQAARCWDIPGSSRRRVAVTTIRNWVRAYRQHGLDGLYPKPRSDRSRPRRLPDTVAGLLLDARRSRPELSVPALMREVSASGQLPEGVRLARSTVYRLLARAGLTGRAGGPGDRRRRRKTYLIAFLDDA